MKQFFAGLLALFVLANSVAYAANTATAQAAQKIYIGDAGPVVPYVVSIDTTGNDLTIVTPTTGYMACVVGVYGSETSATNVTFKSGSTTLAVPELAANQGHLFGLGQGALFCTQAGEALKIQASVAISNLLIHVVQARALYFK